MSKKPSSEAPTKSTPKDAQVMAAILKDMGVTEHEPRVISYVTDILDDAKIYSNHANKKNIDVEDVKLAIQCRLDHSFTTPPPRDLLLDVARHKNSTPLPLIKPYTGPKLPPDRYCLSTTNYRLKSMKKVIKVTKPRVQIQGGGLASSLMSGARFTIQQSSGVKTVGNIQGSSLAIVTRTVTQPAVAIRPAQSPAAPAMPIIRVTPGSTSAVSSSHPSTISTNIATPLTNGIKRKREDEDDYDQA